MMRGIGAVRGIGMIGAVRGIGRMRRTIRTVLAAAAALLAGCASLHDGVGYYWQSISGHLRILQAARPVDDWLADPGTDATLRARLELAREIRHFAAERLALPDNASYTRYADLGRPFVVWNVFATPELSLQLRRWCFPVVGCVDYRGYYNRQEAERYAQTMRARGLEAYVGGVPAYSTLGWFADPLLNTFIRYPEAELARLVFHELAHQVVYVPGDTAFNESFATAVEEAGIERWIAARGDARLAGAYAAYVSRRRDFLDLLGRHRQQLRELYASDADDAAKRARKAEILASLRDEYANLKRDRWGGFAGYDRWFAQPLTNAHLSSVSTYTELVPAFRALLAREGGDLPRFYRAVRALADTSAPRRLARLHELART